MSAAEMFLAALVVPVITAVADPACRADGPIIREGGDAALARWRCSPP